MLPPPRGAIWMVSVARHESCPPAALLLVTGCPDMRQARQRQPLSWLKGCASHPHVPPPPARVPAGPPAFRHSQFVHHVARPTVRHSTEAMVVRNAQRKMPRMGGSGKKEEAVRGDDVADAIKICRCLERR